MGKIKHLGKFTDEGQFINLPFIFETGKYRVEIKPSGENRRDKTIYVDTDGIMKLPNYNGKKAFALGSNIFLIYKIVNGERQRVEIEGFSRWSLFLKAGRGDSELVKMLQQRIVALETSIFSNSTRYDLIGEQNGTNKVFLLPYVPVSNTLKVYRNGVLLNPSDVEDYVHSSDTNTIMFPIAPEEDELLQATFFIDNSNYITDAEGSSITDGDGIFIKN